VGTVLAALAFAEIAREVAAREGMARVDRHLESFVVAHRVGWVTSVAQVAAWVGSSFFLIPMIAIVGGYIRLKHHDWKPLIKLAAALGGAIALYNAFKLLIDRARPPASMRVGSPMPGSSFPSGHTTEATAVWGMVAILVAGAMTRRRWLPALGALLVILIVGVVRIYLGTHWLSDVLAGCALGGAWLGVAAAVMLGVGGRSATHEHDSVPARSTSRDPPG